MLNQKHPFNKNLFLGAVLGLSIAICSGQAFAAEAPTYKKDKTNFYSEIFNQNIYYEGVDYLNFEKLYQKLFRKKVRSKNVNVYDEVPDSNFFVNRHARSRLSLDALKKGYSESAGPDTSKITVVKGKFEGLHPGFFVKDAKGDAYLFKFDPADNLELATAAEVIASRFYHAIGYYVPQYTVAHFVPDNMGIHDSATIMDSTGFRKKLTKDRLEEYLLFIPYTESGKLRASASKILKGENVGNFSFRKRRRNDPDDPVNHQNRREVRSLLVFAAWLNNYDVRKSNTLDMVVKEKGKKVLRHYLIDFNATFGAGTDEPKPPMFTHEHLIDYGEATKAFLSLGLWEKPWQKRWREAGEVVDQSPAIGYFDNRYFDPGKFKTQLPEEAFKMLTRADGFWAAKIIMSFKDDEIRAMVEAGQYSDPKDADYVVKTLIERRDIIGKYWFSQANPLDAFDKQKGNLIFKDLAVKYGFESAKDTMYEVHVLGHKGKKRKKITTLQSEKPSIKINKKWFNDFENVDLLIRTTRKSSASLSPHVLVELSPKGVSGIIHED